MAKTNELYLVVLPLIHLGERDFGLTEETLTLVPDRDFATEFFPDEVDGYLSTFKNRVHLLVGGHSKKWEIHPETMADGKVIVRVVQHVG